MYCNDNQKASALGGLLILTLSVVMEYGNDVIKCICLQVSSVFVYQVVKQR